MNADLTVDVTDLQNIVYYAMNYSKLSGKAFNYTAANAINDAGEAIEVSIDAPEES